MSQFITGFSCENNRPTVHFKAHAGYIHCLSPGVGNFLVSGGDDAFVKGACRVM